MVPGRCALGVLIDGPITIQIESASRNGTVYKFFMLILSMTKQKSRIFFMEAWQNSPPEIDFYLTNFVAVPISARWLKRSEMFEGMFETCAFENSAAG